MKWLMEKVLLLETMEAPMMEIGSKISNVDMALKNGKMDQFSKVDIFLFL
jgi:hypothetical protein